MSGGSGGDRPSAGGGGTSNGGSGAQGGTGEGGTPNGGGTSNIGGTPNGGAGISNGGANIGQAGAIAGSGGGAGLPSAGGAGASQGGNTTTAGSGGAPGGAGAGAGGGTNACSKAGVLVCDDFEQAAVGMAPPAPWSIAVNGTDGTVEIDATTPAHSGTHSVRVQSLGNYQTFLALRGAPVFPAPSPALYVRTYLRLGAAMTSGHNTYFKAGAADTISSDHETRVGVMVGMLMINQPAADRGFLSNEGYWTDMMPGVVFVPNTWVCVEGFFDPPSSTVDFWVDGAEVSDLHRTDWQQDPLGAFHFGFEKYAGPDAEIWYDDIAIGTERLGCD